MSILSKSKCVVCNVLTSSNYDDMPVCFECYFGDGLYNYLKSPTIEVQKWYSSPKNWAKGVNEFDERIGGIEILDLVTDQDVLNLGCFYPNIEFAMAHKAKSWHSIDFVPEVIERCQDFKELHNIVKFSVMDMRYLELPGESFDVVLDLSSGDHVMLDDYEKVLDEVHRVLISGGRFAITYANREYIEDRLVERWGIWGYERRATPKELKDLLMRKGFIILASFDPTTRAGIVCQKKHPL